MKAAIFSVREWFTKAVHHTVLAEFWWVSSFAFDAQLPPSVPVRARPCEAAFKNNRPMLVIASGVGRFAHAFPVHRTALTKKPSNSSSLQCAHAVRAASMSREACVSRTVFVGTAPGTHRQQTAAVPDAHAALVASSTAC